MNINNYVEGKSCLLGGVEHNRYFITERNKLYRVADDKGFINNAIGLYEIVLKKQLTDNIGLPEWYSKSKALEYLKFFVGEK